VSPRVLWFQICLSVREGSGIVACPMAPGPPPGRGGLRCRHVSRGNSSNIPDFQRSLLLDYLSDGSV
jgi:hypothetical protein